MSDKTSRIEQVIQSSVLAKQFMGSILVAQRGRTILDEGYGYANLEWEAPNTPTTKFRIASLTKQFTAAAILLLEEQGALKTTDFISKHMSDAPSAWNDITIFHLLTHTSGIPNYTRFPDFLAMTMTSKTPIEQIAFFRDKPLNFEPGSDFEYNNSAYVLLGYLIEKISAQSYEHFIGRHIFKPLGMNDSGYDSHFEIISHRASGYVATAHGCCNADYLDMSIPYSAGSLYSTTHDMLRWEQSLFGGKLLSIESVKKMTTPFKNGYGCGVRIYSMHGHQCISHAGGTGGFNTKMIYSPDDELVVIVLANLNALSYIAQEIAFKIVAIMRDQEVTLPSERQKIFLSPESLAQFVGHYVIKPYVNAYGLTSEQHLRISLENYCLILEIDKSPKIQLFPQTESCFFGEAPDIQLHFSRDEQGCASQLVLFLHGEKSTATKCFGN